MVYIKLEFSVSYKTSEFLYYYFSRTKSIHTINFGSVMAVWEAWIQLLCVLGHQFWGDFFCLFFYKYSLGVHLLCACLAKTTKTNNFCFYGLLYKHLVLVERGVSFVSWWVSIFMWITYSIGKLLSTLFTLQKILCVVCCWCYNLGDPCISCKFL